ncbi:hypothetical protein LUZ60_006206 [Juncus effusus]|nr:hypothetical protein LUZ60_006206 [Juncus effusus]
MATRKRNRASTATASASGSRTAPSPESNNPSPVSPPVPIAGVFNDASISDLLLRLSLDASPSTLDLHVTSAALRRSLYFDALLSGRWQPQNNDESESPRVITLTVVPSASAATSRRRRPFEGHVSVIKLLHTLDFPSSVQSPTDAIDLLPIALELLFDDLIRFCLRFLDAVPWTEEEELHILSLVPILHVHESKDLLSRLFPPKQSNSSPSSPPPPSSSPSESMLHGLINSAIHAPPNSTSIKTFVATILRDYPSISSIKNVLNSSFTQILESITDLMNKYASPDFRVATDNDEREAMQRLHLHAAMTKIKHLYWIVERMVEMRVADLAVREWSEQAGLGSDLIKILKDENYRNIAPGLPVFLTRCTLRLAGAVVSGHTLAPQQVRTKLVKVWLPVLNTCRDITSSPLTGGAHQQKSVFHELEETFLQLISTLQISDAQDLLQQCLCFSTRNVEDCGHLARAFKTWFRRADRRDLDSVSGV